MDISIQTVIQRMEDMGLSFMAASFESYLSEASREEKPLRLAIYDLKENIIFMGPSGLGKTHLMLALGHKACMTGYTACYIFCMDLIEGLIKARGMNRLKRKLQWFRKPHVLLLDEVGYENLTQEEATLLFQLVNTRYEHGSIILTSNKPFSRWGEIMSDDAVATATSDRLLHHAHIVSLTGESYRMKDGRIGQSSRRTFALSALALTVFSEQSTHCEYQSPCF